MNVLRAFGWIGVVSLGLLTMACEDPANVGGGLVEEQAGAPVVIAKPLATFAPDTLNDITSGVLSSQNTGLPPALAGKVVDDLFGTVEATGYIDFSQVASLSSDFTDGTIAEVVLALVPKYLYGDTLTPVSLGLYDMSEDWVAGNQRARDVGQPGDTAFVVGSEVLTFEGTPTDSVISVPMPAAWITANASKLQNEDFSTLFHGFQLRPTGAMGNAVIGMGVGTNLRVVAGGDTVRYFMSESVSGILYEDDALIPAERLHARDGAGPTVGFTLNLDSDSLKRVPLNRFRLVLHVDTLTAANPPANFVRPPLTEVQLTARLSNGLEALLATTTLEDGQLIFESANLRNDIQALMLEESLIETFRLNFPRVNNTIGSLLLYDLQVSEKQPEAILTVTPVN